MINTDIAKPFEVLPVHASVPHSKGMRLIDKISAFTLEDASIVATLVVDPARFYWNQKLNRFRPLWLVELISQACASLYFHLRQAHRVPVELGFLVTIKSFTYDEEVTIPSGAELRIESKLAVDFYPFGVFESKVFLGDRCVAESTMNLVTKKGAVLGEGSLNLNAF